MSTNSLFNVKTWIFQLRPDKMDLSIEIPRRNYDEWDKNQYTSEIKTNDILFYWMSGEFSGLYGWGRVSGDEMENKNVPVSFEGFFFPYVSRE